MNAALVTLYLFLALLAATFLDLPRSVKRLIVYVRGVCVMIMVVAGLQVLLFDPHDQKSLPIEGASRGDGGENGSTTEGGFSEDSPYTPEIAEPLAYGVDLGKVRNDFAGPLPSPARRSGSEGLPQMATREFGAPGIPSVLANGTLFDVQLSGQFVVVIDRSASMKGERLNLAKIELRRLLKILPDTAKIAIIFFGDTATSIPQNEGKFINDKLQAIDQINAVRAVGNTYLLGALKLAKKYNPDDVYLLSDGVFLDFNNVKEWIDSNAGNWPAGRHPIHGTYVGTDAKGLKQLSEIAEITLGDFKQFKTGS